MKFADFHDLKIDQRVYMDDDEFTVRTLRKDDDGAYRVSLIAPTNVRSLVDVG